MTPHDPPNAVAPPTESTRTPWLTAAEAAERAKCDVRLIRASVRRGKLRAAKLGVRGRLRIHESWLDAWITSFAVVNPDAPGAEIAPPTQFERRRRS